MQLRHYIEDLALEFEQKGLFFGHGTDNARDEACALVAWGLDLDWSELPGNLARNLSSAEIDALGELVRQRIERRVPLAYLTGEAWFCGHRFISDARALVPRSPIAELIENRLKGLLHAPPHTVLDLCCGGGCIGIAAALEFLDARVDLVDLSAEALALSDENIRLHKLAGRVRTARSDLFAEIPARRYDLILCNPPYVSQREYNELPSEYHAEPSAGLVSADEGLALPLRVLAGAADFLSEDGRLILEVGATMEDLIDRCPEVPFMWLEFDYGGGGVLSLRRDELLSYQQSFAP